jgi:hypothetical protein
VCKQRSRRLACWAAGGASRRPVWPAGRPRPRGTPDPVGPGGACRPRAASAPSTCWSCGLVSLALRLRCSLPSARWSPQRPRRSCGRPPLKKKIQFASVGISSDRKVSRLSQIAVLSDAFSVDSKRSYPGYLELTALTVEKMRIDRLVVMADA